VSQAKKARLKMDRIGKFAKEIFWKAIAEAIHNLGKEAKIVP